MNFREIVPYIKIARPDNWFKNIFMLPGFILAFFYSPHLLSWAIVPDLVVAVIATCLVASSNYIINEILDAPSDALHPVKKNRPIPSGRVNVKIAYAEWIFLAVLGLAAGWCINLYFFLSLAAFLFMGQMYNVPPVRLKDLPYLDVLSEAVNNPLRLFLGWLALDISCLPPLSFILAYWMIGSFFMAIKRYAEYKRIADPEIAKRYRASFSYYNEYRLLLSIVYYASAFSLFFGIFLIRYRIELILSVPFLAGFIPVYMRLAFWEDSPAQYPERLYRQRGLVVYSSFCFLLILILFFVDVPVVGELFRSNQLAGIG